ncbi:MAG: hypothetical protein D6719_06650 [Candidatus Dadabacteria bacterium]|nr:MAG: hypothetical protein D6719_06650 [Candidatus Dadabacteria bacterium]
MRYLHKAILLGVFIVASAGAVSAENASTIREMFTNGKAYVHFRYRYEFVDQDGFDNDANALTLKSVLGYRTANWNGLSAVLEAEDVHATGQDNFNSTDNGKTQYPVVADPDGTEVNQAYISYDGLPDTVIRGGRYLLTLDNHRFVGDVGWRQNDQVYDGAGLTNTWIDGLTFSYNYINNVERVTGTTVDSSSHLINARYSGIDAFDITLFAYLIDLGNDAPALSSNTFGGRLNGSTNLSEQATLLYDLSYATQRDAGDNPTDYDADYINVEAGVGFGGFTLKGGYELLGSDNGAIGFSTPLATLHRWNGWADMFLSTPANGLEDIYGSIGYKFSGLDSFFDGTQFLAVYHDFSSDEGSMDYGTEWDLKLVTPIDDTWTVGMWYASYSADNFGSDTDKFWVSISAKFDQGGKA